MPVYNVEEYLPNCLESVNKQTYKKIELLIIDDGSTDSSGSICDSFCAKHSYAKTIHLNNGGVSIARNTGLDNASGDYIVFIDSDDILSEVYIEELVTLMNKSEDEMGIVGYDSTDVSNLSRATDISSCLCESSFIIDNLIKDRDVGGYLWNKIFKRSIIEQENIRFLKNVLIWEDLYFVLQYLNNISQVCWCKSKYYYYRKRESSAVRSITLEKKFNKVGIAKKICEFEVAGCDQFHNDSERVYMITYYDYCWSAFKLKGLDKGIKKDYFCEVKKYNGLKHYSAKDSLNILFLWLFG